MPRSIAPRTSPRLAGAAALALCLAACGGGGDVTSPPSSGGGSGSGGTLTVEKAPVPNGDGQTGPVSQALPAPLRIVVRQDGAAKSGVAVAWATAGGSGTINPPSAVTDANGLASAVWTLGPAAGAQTATAAVAGAQGSPLTFTATATAAGGGGGGGTTVTVGNNFFSPQTLTVPAGTTVTWTWSAGALQHTITPNNSSGQPSEPDARNGPFQYQFTFTTPGTYDYYCSVHGLPGAGMHGTVIVQ